MMKEFHVTGIVSADAALPAADVIAAGLRLPVMLPRAHTIRVEGGPQWQRWASSGSRRQDDGRYQAWAAAPGSPVDPADGRVTAPPRRAAGDVLVTLAPGITADLFRADSGDRNPTAHGMLQEIVIN
jgi:hypothetical protein